MCAVGGTRGGLVPAWFGSLPPLGVELVWLFWAVPAGDEACAQLDLVKLSGKRWITELRALGMDGELLIKRGQAGPWLTALARACRADLVVAGPPAVAGRESRTLTDLLMRLNCALLLLPATGAPERELLARPLVNTEGSAESAALVDAWTAGRPERTLLRLGRLSSERAGRAAVRAAIELDATALVMAAPAPAVALYVLQHGTIPILLAPPHPRFGVPAPRDVAP
ncbi:MAG: hypothetical protein HY561_00640 [Gemmatimonadetes bacterium]|nr:hypothetical protein [Gemmatimonadota bacterium]